MGRRLKHEGIARLHAESRRFQDELRCIQSSLCCPPLQHHAHNRHHHHGRHRHCYHHAHRADTSEEGSERSVWDSPQAAKTLILSSLQDKVKCVGLTESTTQETSSSREYTVRIPSSCRAPDHQHDLVPSSQCNHGISQRIGSDPNATSQFEPDGRGVRITATTFFTANGGNLMFHCPASFQVGSSNQRCEICDKSIATSSVVISNGQKIGPFQNHEICEVEFHEQKPCVHGSGAAVLLNHASDIEKCRKGWRGETVEDDKDSSCICTKSSNNGNLDRIGTEDSNLATSLHVKSDTPRLADPLKIKVQGSITKDNAQPNNEIVNSLGTVVGKAPENAEKANHLTEKIGDQSINEYICMKLHGADKTDCDKLELPSCSSEAKYTGNVMKLKERFSSSKDSALCRRMASRIKFILQSLTPTRRGINNIQSRELNHGITVTQHPGLYDRNKEVFPAVSKESWDPTQFNQLSQTRISGIPDAESYLEHVVSALCFKKESKPEVDAHDQFKMVNADREKTSGRPDPGIPAMHEEGVPLQLEPMVKRTVETCEPASCRFDTFHQSPLAESKLSASSKGENIQPLHGRCNEIEKENRVQVSNENNLLDYIPPIWPVEDLAAVNKGHNVAENSKDVFLKSCREKVCNFLAGNLMIDENAGKGKSTNTEESVELEKYTQEGDHIVAEQGSRVIVSQKELDSGPCYGKSPARSNLDIPVEAAVQAASDLVNTLARNAAPITPQPSAQQLAAVQEDRKMFATKAVQDLLGEDFNYNSMYQELKTLQVERRKLEVRAKTTVHLLTSSKEGDETNKKNILSREQYLRRKADTADSSFTVSEAKRRRTLKSSERYARSKGYGLSAGRNDPIQNNLRSATVVSSLDISLLDQENWDLEKDFRDIGLKKQNQGKTRAASYGHFPFRGNYTLQSSVSMAAKRKSKPPAWAERMTQGRPSHDFDEFRKRKPSGLMETKKCVVRKSVRPPGSIFKSTTHIEWASDPISKKRSNMHKGKMQNERKPGLKVKVKRSGIPKDHLTSQGPVEHPSSDALGKPLTISGGNIGANDELGAQDVGVDELKDDKGKHETNGRVESSKDNVAGIKSLLKSFPEDVHFFGEEEGTQKKLVGPAKVGTMPENVSSGLFTTERKLHNTFLDPNAHDSILIDDYKRKLDNELTQGALLAATLESILNDQTSDEIGDLEKSNDMNLSIANGSLEVECQTNMSKAKQDCKGVQTTESNNTFPTHMAFPSIPIFPAYVMPDSQMLLQTSSYYIPPTHSVHPLIPSHEAECSNSAFSNARRKGAAQSCRPGKRLFQKVRWKSRICTKPKHYLSSTPTPSSPSSIHEIEDICETSHTVNQEMTLAMQLSNQGLITENIKGSTDRSVTSLSRHKGNVISDNIKQLEPFQASEEAQVQVHLALPNHKEHAGALTENINGTTDWPVTSLPKHRGNVISDNIKHIEPFQACKEAQVQAHLALPNNKTEDLLDTDANEQPHSLTTQFKKDENQRKDKVTEVSQTQFKKQKNQYKDEVTEVSQAQSLHDSMDLAMIPRLLNSETRSSKVFKDEGVVTKRRLTLVPFREHIYPSPENSARRSLAKFEIPTWALVAKSDSKSPFLKGVVPRWSEIKRPMMVGSSSEDSSSIATTNSGSSSSLGQLHEKALAILRESVYTSRPQANGVSERPQQMGNSLSSVEISDGEIPNVPRRTNMVAEPYRSSIPEPGESSNVARTFNGHSSEGEMSPGCIHP